MSIQNLKRYKAFDAGFALLVSDGRYAKIVDQDGNEVLWTPNPVVHQGVSLYVRWDEATKTFIPERTPSPLEDTYTKGTFYELNHTPNTFGGGLSDMFTPLDSSGNFVKYNPLSLDWAYSDAAIHPVLIIEVFEARLASRQYFLYVGDKLTDANAPTYLSYTKDQLINALAADYVTKAQAALDAFFGTGSVVITYNATDFTFDINGLAKEDGYVLEGEFYTTAIDSSPHITQPSAELPLVMPYWGTNFFGLKPFKGAYIMFSQEKLILLPEVLKRTLDNLTTITQDQKDELFELLGYRLGDYFKGMSQEITVQGKTVIANVFMSVLSSGTMLATVTIEDPANPGNFIDVAAVPVNIEDAFVYDDGKLHKAYPDALQYITGPYGALPIRDPQTGNVIAFYSDAYSK